MPRNTGLMDADGGNEVVDLTLASPQCIDDAAAGGIGKREKRINMHVYAYAFMCI